MPNDPFSAQAQQLSQIAATKDSHALANASDAFWADGSAGDCIWAIGEALETGMRHNPGTPIWHFYVDDNAYFFIGSFTDVKARIEAL